MLAHPHQWVPLSLFDRNGLMLTDARLGGD
jgi:hypothetical protein